MQITRGCCCIQSTIGQMDGTTFPKEVKSLMENRACGEIIMPGNWPCIYSALSTKRNITPSLIVWHDSKSTERSFSIVYSYNYNKAMGHRDSGKKFFETRRRWNNSLAGCVEWQKCFTNSVYVAGFKSSDSIVMSW